MTNSIATIGPVLGLAVSFCLIARKVPTFWSLLAGAALGGLLGGGGMAVGAVMLRGSYDMLPTVACILASGILAGALVYTGSAEKIADSILKVFGVKWALASMATAVLLLTACGVFVDIAVITAAPIALAVGSRTGRSRSSMLLAMIGGGKAGNIVSPNPNTIAAAKAFQLELSELMAVNLVPAICAFACTLALAAWTDRKREKLTVSAANAAERTLPSFAAAISGPAVVLGLLALRPLCGIAVDPVVALPVGGIVCILITGHGVDGFSIGCKGLRQVAGVALLLLGTGALAGVIQASNLRLDVIRGLEILHLPPVWLAPLSGILMGGAAASTTAGTAIASQTFGPALLDAGIPALSAAAMIHAGATVLDSLPHGSFFHATAGCADLTTRQRLSLLLPEAVIGLTSTIAAMVIGSLAA